MLLLGSYAHGFFLYLLITEMAPPVLAAASAIAIAGLARPTAEKLESESRAHVLKKFKAVRSVKDDLQSLSDQLSKA